MLGGRCCHSHGIRIEEGSLTKQTARRGYLLDTVQHGRCYWQPPQGHIFLPMHPLP